MYIKGGLDPEEVSQKVLEAIRQEQFRVRKIEWNSVKV